MTKTLIEKLTHTPEGMRLFQQERAIQEATDLICELMEEDGVTRADLARRLGKTKGYITQLLDGGTNMTVRTLSDALGALDRTVHFQDGPLTATLQPAPLLSIREGLNWGKSFEVWPDGISLHADVMSAGERMVG